jgi:UDP-N-acetylglucosamine--N-acetylmuramyl-(pentapeptide) pyrophosphoryl-undecaprenol N-acetylglucosamine transferase
MGARLGSLTEPRDVRILVTGGGTGGHVTPALAVIQSLQQMAQGAQWHPAFLYLGSSQGVEARLARENGIPFTGVQSGKLRRSKNPLALLSGRNLIDMGRVPIGIGQSLGAVREFRPHVVLATGGYVSVPPVLAASLLKIPALIHEQTVQMGLANRITAPFAARIALTFESTLQDLSARQKQKAFVTGNPIRAAVLAGDRERARLRYGWLAENSHFPVIYITGGAQGAQRINTAVEAVLRRLLQEACVIHQCGAQDLSHFQGVAAQLPEELKSRYVCRDFVGEEIGDVYALADILIGRSGAGTVAEAAATGKPAIFIPLVPTGGDEQTRNAQRAVEAGAAILVPQEGLSGEQILSALLPLLKETEQRAAMAMAARKTARPEAAHDLAAAVLNLAGVS